MPGKDSQRGRGGVFLVSTIIPLIANKSRQLAQPTYRNVLGAEGHVPDSRGADQRRSDDEKVAALKEALANLVLAQQPLKAEQ